MLSELAQEVRARRVNAAISAASRLAEAAWLGPGQVRPRLLMRMLAARSGGTPDQAALRTSATVAAARDARREAVGEWVALSIARPLVTTTASVAAVSGVRSLGIGRALRGAR